MPLWLWHAAESPWAQAIADDVLRVLLCVVPGSVERVRVHFGDRYGPIDRVVDMAPVGCDDVGEWWRADLQLPSRRYQYRFEMTVNGETWHYGERGAAPDTDAAGVFQVPYLCSRDRPFVPEWTRQAVAYQIFPDRFAKGGDPGWPHVDADDRPTSTSVYGGNLAGVLEKLDHLADLGVNLIYCTPIFTAPSNHKYDTEDYFRIDPQFGTMEDLRRLVDAAHQRGIRVLLDAVFNHCGERFAPFQDVVRRGPASPYWDWFFIDGDAVDLNAVNYETFANRLRSMPKLNVANPDVERYLLSVAEYWMRTCDIDGWRLDVANEIDHVFWRTFRTHVKRIRPDALIIGEVWHDSLPWLRGDQFDGVMNYVFRDIVLDGLVDGLASLERTAVRLTRLALRYPPAAAQASLNLLGSHDTERLWTRARGNLATVEAAMALQFLWPGIPMVYYGDEVGMEGGNDPDCRRPMRWDGRSWRRDLLQTVRELARLRRMAPALASAEVRVWTDGPTALMLIREGSASRIGARFSTRLGSWAAPGEVLVERRRADGEWSFVIWRE